MKPSLRELSWLLILGGLVACSTNTSATIGDSPDAAVEYDAAIPERCGDGLIGDLEACDDGANAPGDGCNASCQVEEGFGCEGAPSICAPVCGDSIIVVPEECDDGNSQASDGCSDLCEIETGFVCPTAGETCLALNGSCELPFELLLVDNAGVLEGSVSGDTIGATGAVAAALCDGTSVGVATDLIYSFILPDSRDVTLTATFAIDGLFRVLSMPCDPEARVAGEIAFGDACADIGGLGEDETLRLQNLAAGTYYVVVDGSAAGDEGAFTLSLAAIATTCGDGVVDTSEECDDGNAMLADGCSNCVLDPRTRCVGEPSVCSSTCQDGIVDFDALEQCDDGNAINDDRCSDLCELEFDVLDAEPNDATVEAQPVLAGEVIVGSLLPDDFDIYELVLASDSWVTLEGYNTIDGDATNYNGNGQLGPLLDCDSNDFDLHLFDAAGDVSDVASALISDDLDGVGNCPYIGSNRDLGSAFLVAGTYYIRVDAFTPSNTIFQYAVDVRVDAPLAADDACDDQFNLCESPLLGCNPATMLCELLCGDGVVDANEECDDGNVADADRCSNTCLLNADVVDMDGNDTFATAQALGAGEVARGSLEPAADPFDLYSFTLAGPSWLTVEQYNTVDGDTANYAGTGLDDSMDCNSDLQVRIFDVTGDPTDNTTAILFDDDDGDGLCGYLATNQDGASVFLDAGTYYIKANEFGENNAIDLYAMDLQIDTPLQIGATCDPDFDLCDPAFACDVGTNTCLVPAPPSIDRSNYEQFSGGFDLANTSLVFSPGGATYGVMATPAVAAYPDTPGTGTVSSSVIALADDSWQEITLATPFPFFGVDETSLFLGSNGYITFGNGDVTSNETIATHFALPRISFFFDDLNPSGAGTITFDEFVDHATITFNNVPAFGGANAVQVQVQLFADGTITMTYLNVSELDCIVGVSAGDDEGNPPLPLDFSAQTPVVPIAGDLVINEVLANAAGVDSNCDGVISSSRDEFIELVNVSGVPLDLTGLTISDAILVRHTFAALVLPHGQSVVVYGGGTPSCPDVLGVVATASALGLNNTGDTVTLGTGDTMTYGANTAGISLTLSEDLVGADYVNHDLVGGSAGNFSPGFRATGEAF